MERQAKQAEKTEAFQVRVAERQARLDHAGELKQWVQDNKTTRVASCGEVHLFADRIIHLPGLFSPATAGSFPTSGMSAAVDTAGGVYGKGTLGRSLVSLGTWQKKKDNRESWLWLWMDRNFSG